jgi:hypothetical protein
MSVVNRFKTNLLGSIIASSLVLAPALGPAASIDDIIQTVDQEKVAGNMKGTSYQDVMTPLNAAKQAQADGDTEAYSSEIEAARLVVNAAVEESENSIEPAAAGRILIKME